MQTVIGGFDTAEQAEKAAQDLVSAGIARDDISLVANNESGRYAPISETSTEEPSVTGHAIGHDAVVGAEWGAGIGFIVGLTSLAIPGLGWIAGAGWLMGTLLGAGTGAVIGGLVGALTHVGVPEEDAHRYTAAVRHGSVLLAVRASDEKAQQVADILDREGAINIDKREEEYRQKGFLPTSSTPQMNDRPATQSVPAATNARMESKEGETVLPVIEEAIQVGKRDVQRGGVRVYSHVTERPIEENVTLREEHVTVDRRPVNRAVSDSDFNGMRDQTIEIPERAEEVVISKQARIVEEVVVGKESTERNQQVHETVRRTDVEVEKLPGQSVTTDTGNHTPRNMGEGVVNGVKNTEGNRAGDGTPDTRGAGEKVADAVTGDRIDDKTGKAVA